MANSLLSSSLVFCTGSVGLATRPGINPEQQALIDEHMITWSMSAGCPKTLLHRCGAVAAVSSEDSYYGVHVVAGQNFSQYYPITGKAGSATLFEIQSVTKIFAALLLMLLVEEGVVQYNTTLASVLTPLTTLQLADDRVRDVTLEEILTHHSGLPEMPLNLTAGRGTSNKFHGYTRANLIGDLSKVVLKPKRFLYSNFAFGILGYLEELVTGKQFVDLVTERICKPLGLYYTTIAAGNFTTRQWRNNVIPGLSPATGNVAWRNDSYGILKANGALVSSINDLVQFVRATLRAIVKCGASRDSCSPLQRALASAAGVHAPIEGTMGSQSMGYAWEHVFDRLQQFATLKTGDGEGYSIFVGFERAKENVVVAFDTCGGCEVYDPARDTSRKPLQKAALEILTLLQTSKLTAVESLVSGPLFSGEVIFS